MFNKYTKICIILNKSLLKICAVMLLTLVVLAQTGCSYNYLKDGNNTEQVISYEGKGNSMMGALVSERYTLKINKVKARYQKNVGMIIIDEDLDNNINLTGNSEVLKNMNVIVDEKNKVITISSRKTYTESDGDLKIEIGVPITKIDIEEGKFDIDFNLPTIKELSIKFRSACSGNIKVGNLNEFNMDINGSGRLELEGNCAKNVANINGASEINAYDFITESSDISINGAAIYNAYVTETLKAEIKGLGMLTYDGKPKNVSKSVKGLGSIKER